VGGRAETVPEVVDGAEGLSVPDVPEKQWAYSEPHIPMVPALVPGAFPPAHRFVKLCGKAILFPPLADSLGGYESGAQTGAAVSAPGTAVGIIRESARSQGIYGKSV